MLDKRKWKFAEDEFLIENYVKLETKEIAIKLNRTCKVIRTRARKLNLNKNYLRLWDKNEENYLKENYKLIPTLEISKFLNKSIATIIAKAVRLGLSASSTRKYFVNENYFDNWNEVNSYFYGFWTADGYFKTCRGKCNSVGIGLQGQDKYILEKFRNGLGGCEVKKHKKRNFYVLEMHSKKLVLKMKEFGALERKSLIVDFPKINDLQIQDYVRGFLDGDGTIRIHTKKDGKYPSLEISFCGGELFLNGLRNILFPICGKNNKICPATFSKKKQLWVCNLSYGGKTAEKICKWVYYKNDCLCLDRKYEVFKSWKELKGLT